MGDMLTPCPPGRLWTAYPGFEKMFRDFGAKDELYANENWAHGEDADAVHTMSAMSCDGSTWQFENARFEGAED
jgi:hypothetical protein